MNLYYVEHEYPHPSGVERTMASLHATSASAKRAAKGMKAVVASSDRVRVKPASVPVEKGTPVEWVYFVDEVSDAHGRVIRPEGFLTLQEAQAAATDLAIRGIKYSLFKAPLDTRKDEDDDY